MKSLVLLVSTVVAFSAFAGEYSKPSSVLFQSASTYVPAEKVCRNGDTLLHKTKATIAVKYCNDSKTECKTVTKALSQPVISTAQRCAKFEGDDCVAWESYTLNQATVNVFTYNDDGENGYVSGKYTIPACKTGGGVAN